LCRDELVWCGRVVQETRLTRYGRQAHEMLLFMKLASYPCFCGGQCAIEAESWSAGTAAPLKESHEKRSAQRLID
jgi:hypothetical protein